MEGYEFVIYREWRQTGCVMEDGADTRKNEYKIRVIPKHQEEEYLEDCASEYGNQDYSYKFDTKLIAELDYDVVVEIAFKVIMATEEQDITNHKDKYQMIATKLQNILKDFNKGDEE